jgi:hypothetical protein
VLAEQVGDHGVCRRHTTGLTTSHQEAARGQLPHVKHHAGERGHDAPEGQAERNDPVAVAVIGEPRDRNAKDGIEDGEGGAVYEPENRIGEVHLGFDGRKSQRQN